MKTILFAFVILFALGAFFKSAKFKGIMGEMLIKIANTVIRFFRRNQFTILGNILIPSDDGTTQIDHILISQHGLFVIETKNISGWIFGSPSGKFWTQKLNKNHSQKFQNPLFQNYKHTKTLADITGIAHDKIKSVVVFVGDTKFKTDLPENVIRLCEYIPYMLNQKDIVFTEEEKNIIHQKIVEKRVPTNWKTARQHVKDLKHCHKPSTNCIENE